jgi:hypothetical protein
MKKSILIICILAVAFCISGALLAQPDPGTQQNGNEVGGNTLGAGAPIRGGATILIAFSLACAIGRSKW